MGPIGLHGKFVIPSIVMLGARFRTMMYVEAFNSKLVTLAGVRRMKKASLQH